MDKRIWHDAYDEGVPAELDFEEITLPRMLERAAREYADRPSVIFLNCRLTYRQLQDEVDRFATALAGMGVTKDSKVAIQLPNLPQTVIAFYGVLRLGAQAVMTNPLYVEREIEHQWQDAECSVAITTDFLFEARVRGIRDKLPVQHYIIASVPEYLRFPLNILAPLKLKRSDPPLIADVEPGDGIYFMRSLIRETAPNPPAVEIGLDDVAVLQYTGGTTGVSKGAMLTQRNLSCNIQQVAGWFHEAVPGREVVLASLPYFHVFGLTVAMGYPVFAGFAMVLMPNPRDIPMLIKNIAKHRVTILPAVPAQFNAVNNHSAAKKADLSSVKVCVSGSAPLPATVGRQFETLTGATISEGFGLTETSPLTHANPVGGTRKEGSIGVPVPNTDAMIVDLDEGNRELEPGHEGELVVAGPQGMKGYWKRDGATADMIRDGWLHTGDIAVMDDDGYFTIVGRKKDMIIASGYNIYPDEVDRILMAHPAVLESATIGVPHEKRGETVKSFVVLCDGESATADQLVEHARRELAAYKVPRMIEFRDELPKSTVLKVLRRELRAQEIAKIKGE